MAGLLPEHIYDAALKSAYRLGPTRLARSQMEEGIDAAYPYIAEFFKKKIIERIYAEEYNKRVSYSNQTPDRIEAYRAGLRRAIHVVSDSLECDCIRSIEATGGIKYSGYCGLHN